MTAHPTDPVRIVALRGERALLAARSFEPEERILVAEGIVSAAPTRTTVQIGPAEHLDVPPQAAYHEHAWQFLNHACRPNTAFRGTTLIALTAIETGEELTFDYETTEWELASPFACACGREGCEGREIRGFRFLTAKERTERLAHLREDLRRLARVDGDSTPRDAGDASGG